jgi:AcrR family transcriptional regulator
MLCPRLPLRAPAFTLGIVGAPLLIVVGDLLSCHTGPVTAAGTRARNRAALTREIADTARRHLATERATGLSLRAVAREMGMASSAVYRYFPSRDDLLTALIVDAYDALGAAAEEAEATARRDDLRARLHGVCAAVRSWALAHPHEYALVYGSPVPGYAAPETTLGPASRVGGVLSGIVVDGLAAGVVDPGTGGADAALVPAAVEAVGLPVDPGTSVAARTVQVWTALFGLVSFELFGQTHDVVARHEEFFRGAVERLGDLLGLPQQ